MIYGMSLLYGLTGFTNFSDIAKILQSGGDTSPLLFVSTLMILVGFGYKIAMVPFHMWCPDVYEGAPTPVTAFLSVAPKAAGFSILIRFFFSLFVTSSGGNFLLTRSDVPWTIVLGLLSALTMTVGNLGALKQTNIKRLLAYSSIAHCGYLLMGVVVLSNAGLSAILLYFVIYLFMNMGAFLVIIAYRDVLHSEDIKDYKGLGWRSPFLAVVLSVFLFSLTGLPPLAGFIGKLYLFAAVVEVKFYWLAVIGALNGALSLYYYARVIKVMFLEGRPEVGSQPQPLPVPVYYTYLAALLVIPIFILGVYWIPLSNIADKSIQIIILIK
jgi:NADH-quinone oxidoreductase subunit N